MLQRALSLSLILFASVCLVLVSTAQARIGVGVGTGKIQVDEQLKPGLIYNLPPLTVLNTGDEKADYEVGISYHEAQEQQKPKESWFVFSPQKFTLEPGATQTVEMKLNLPLAVSPGEYFAYVEAHPLQTVEKGDTRIGIAAGTKLYFTVVASNVFQAAYYKVVSFWNVYRPWPQRFLILVSIVGAWLILKKYFHLEIGIKPKSKDLSKKETNETKHE